MAERGESSKKSESRNSEDDGNLVLYHFYPSFFSQKVVFALYEKKLKFKSHIVNLFEGEQFSPSFLKLNPKGEVPVLKDGVKIIPDSSRIIDYLEDNFSNGDTPRLKPEKGSPQYQKMERLISLLDKVQMGRITFGCLLHPELTEKIKLPPAEVKARTGRFAGHAAMMDEFAEKHKEFADFYRSKKEGLQQFHNSIQDVGDVKKALDELGEVLDEIEKELESADAASEKQWLCGERFTIPDITLGIILHRLQMLGLWNRYFGNSKHSKLNRYFKRIQQRESFRRTVNQGSGIIGTFCCLGTKEKIAVSLGSAMIVLGIAGLAAFLVQRKK